MSRKRRNTSSPECDPGPPPKRPRSITPNEDSDEDSFDDGDVTEQPRLDPDSGLHNAFPGLGVDGDELFYGPAYDGMDYLRMVRSEARGVPSLLVANTRIEIESTLEKDEELFGRGGIYTDGAYAAGPPTPQSSSTLPLAQQKYHEALLERFMTLRAVMRGSPPLPTIQALDKSRPITLPPGSAIARGAWERHMLQNDPHPVQVASIDSDSLLELIKVLSGSLAKLVGGGQSKATRLASWVWALLARFPDRGELGSEEIAELRSLVSKGLEVFGTSGLRSTTTDTEDEEPDDGDDDIGSLLRQVTEARVEVKDIGSTVDNPNHVIELWTPNSVILNAILTIIGDVYGQRDLLEYREVWSEVKTVPEADCD